MSVKTCHQDMQSFWLLLAEGLCGGQPIRPLLASIAQALPPKPMGEVAQALANDIAEDGTLFGAIKKHPTVFSKAHVSLIEGGERLGIVDRVVLLILEGTWRCPTCGNLQFPD